MNTSVWLAALLMGWAGSPHCLAMCGPLCATQSRAVQQGAFQLGRMTGYALAGALAGASMQLVGDWSVHVQSLRPVWAFFHAVFLIWGLLMLIRGDQPLFMVQAAAQIWRWMQSRVSVLAKAPIWTQSAMMGLVWVFWPCGLLFSALTLAALSGSPGQGAITMLAFALGSGVVLAAVPMLWRQRLKWGQPADWGRWRHLGIRLAGAVLAGMSGWALWMGLVQDQAPWCVTPS
jgi:sulfite exporter TauE/SafE